MNKLFALIIIFTLVFPVFAIEENSVENFVQTQERVESYMVNEPAEEMSPITETNNEFVQTPTSLPLKYKQPTSKKKLAKKFLIAMFCVVFTSVFLYSVLTLYNKIKDIFSRDSVIPPEGEKPLDTPNDLTEAIKTFIDKTHWRG